MKSVEVYGVIREFIGPWCKTAGFRRGSGGMLSYFRPTANGFETFWFQCDKWGWDRYSGSQFTMEFQRGDDHRPGAGVLRVRIARLLTAVELEQAQVLQNLVIGRLHRPPPDHAAYTLGPELQETYLEQFEPIRRPWTAGDDIWLKYFATEDVRQWASFLAPLMTSLVERFAAVRGTGLYPD